MVKRKILKLLKINWQQKNNIYFDKEYPIPEDIYFKAGGCKQYQRSKSPLESSFYDMKVYKKFLKDIFNKYKPKLILDLGCGDGRFTLEILNNFSNTFVVAVDSNFEDLNFIEKCLTKEQKERILLICSSAEKTIFLEEIFDFIVLSEVAYVLKNPIKIYKKIFGYLKPNGLAFISNVAKQSYFLHALINNDWEQVKNILLNSKYTDKIRGVKNLQVEVHLYTLPKLVEEVKNVGFEIVKHNIIYGEHALILHKLRKEKMLDDSKIDLVQLAFDNPVGIERIYTILARKKI